MLYVVLNKDLDNKFAIQHVDRDYINISRINFYLDVKNENLNKNIEYLASLKDVEITSIELYDDNKFLYDYSPKFVGELIELSDRLEDLLITGGIERTIRAVIHYKDLEEE